MDKLQPFIKYHFWLLFILAFVMPPLAWWMTTSDLQATITERTNALDTSYGSISDGVDKPNDDWITRAEELIHIRKETNTRTVERLWEWQKSLVKWPPSVSQSMNACPYRGEITDSSIARRVPIDYRRNYSREVRRVWLLSEPIGHETDPIPPNAPRKVWFPLSQMPQVPAEKWQNLPPSFIEIWNSQEDLWLLEQLMMAVKRTNANSNTITDSFVREIREVGLFGGTRVQPNEVSAGAAASASLNPMMSGAPPAFSGARKTGRRIPTSSKFNLEQEFKVKGLTAVTGRRNSSSLSSMNEGMGMSMNEGMPGSEGTTNTASASADLNVDENRYVTAKDAYRTRGFHLVVTMHQQYVPDLIRELLDSQYPIDIIRMEQVARNPDEPDGSTESRPGGPESGGPTSFGPVAGVPSSSGAFDSGEEEPDIPEDSPNEGIEGEGFDEMGEGESSTAPITNSAVKLALSELDLVEFSIVGEMYLYNPPKPAEGEEAAPVEGTITNPPPSTPETTEPGIPTTPETGTTELAVPETSSPTTPAAGTTGTPSPATPAPATPAPVTPEGGTPAPAAPKPATPAPATPDSGTPAPAKPEPETPAGESGGT
jgi:hypothetical protein